ncbi:chitobiase/beta-hexosaminidase C-terminal domain-containing protein [uncultured Methanobrevibacter sp.]|uniref:chitobiase/beta-hexosaminidase C-terminal domain-containing protein n=1 Tax=uncultured Methanobrevibacter sp. TaxID=253161 RepID=UPI002593FAD3|nr:chitobiase/beta-hexosaminidase C-terminal domain-containing protein [uncultured Methanobrevibacter sp.]
MSCVCADVGDNSTVVGDSFNEFENVDVIYDNLNELRDDISEGPFFYGDVNQVERSSNKVNTSLEVNDLVMYYKNGSKFNVVLKDSSDNVLVNKNVIINVNGVNYIRTTNNLGFASLDIRLLPGFYVVNVYFNGDSDFNPSTSISGVFVKSTIYSENLVKMFRNNTVFAALFFNNQGNPLKNQEITFIVNGVSYSKITNNQGVAGLGINLNPGNYTIITKNNFNQEVVQNNIEVKPLICENKDLVKYFKNDSQYVVKIIGKNGRVVGAGESVTFNINGIFYTKITNETGDVKLSIGLNPGEYIVTVEYLGCMVSNKITVLTILISNDLKMNYGDGSSFRVKILDNRGNPLNNTNVTFNINGVFYNRVTDNYGIARLGIRLTTGEYIVTSIYGDYSKGNNIIISNSGSTTYDSFGISHNRGFYNVSSLNVSIFCDELTVLKYSFDNVNWTEHVGSLNFSFSSGVWDLYYKFDSFSIYHVNYEIDNVGPIVWANYGSDLYDFPILVNLTAYDNVDENPSIFYTLNGSDPKIYGVRYNNPFTISSTTTLKFYTKDITNHKSDVVIVNYIFAHIGNLNTGKGFNSIQSAINDVDTVSGNVIKVKPGVYNENIVISKSIALVGDVNGSVILKGVNSNNPVIGITKNANNTLIYGLKITDSNFGIVVLESNNVTLLSNSFNNVVESIICQNDSNTQIANNTIGFSNVVNGVTGIHIRSSKNLFVLNNTISLKSNSGSSCGIVSVFNDGCNMSIVNNKITNIYNGGFGITLQGFNIRIYKNNISNLRNGLAIDCSNSNISFNNLFDNEYGLYIHISRNNSYVSNNIYNNTKYGAYLDSSSISLNDKFYLNRLVNNGYFDFYSASSYVINISDNWWGEHYPKVSRNNYILANIFNGTGGVVLDSWIKISLYSASYEVLDGFLQRAKIYIDMNYNNLNKMVSNDEYLPDMWGGNVMF